MKFVNLNGRVCTVCDQEPRFFHENDDGSVTCCKHIDHKKTEEPSE